MLTTNDLEPNKKSKSTWVVVHICCVIIIDRIEEIGGSGPT